MKVKSLSRVRLLATPWTSRNKNRQPNSTSKAAGKRRTKRPQSLQKERIIKIRAEINEKEMKEAVAKINKVKAGSMRK